MRHELSKYHILYFLQWKNTNLNIHNSKQPARDHY